MPRLSMSFVVRVVACLFVCTFLAEQPSFGQHRGGGRSGVHRGGHVGRAFSGMRRSSGNRSFGSRQIGRSFGRGHSAGVRRGGFIGSRRPHSVAGRRFGSTNSQGHHNSGFGSLHRRNGSTRGLHSGSGLRHSGSGFGRGHHVGRPAGSRFRSGSTAGHLRNSSHGISSLGHGIGSLGHGGTFTNGLRHGVASTFSHGIIPSLGHVVRRGSSHGVTRRHGSGSHHLVVRPHHRYHRGHGRDSRHGRHTYLRFPGYVGFGLYSSYGRFGYDYPPYDTTTYIYAPVYEYQFYDDSAYEDAEDREGYEDEFLETAPADEEPDDSIEDEPDPADSGSASDDPALRQAWFEADALSETVPLESEWDADESAASEEDIADLQGVDDPES